MIYHNNCQALHQSHPDFYARITNQSPGNYPFFKSKNNEWTCEYNGRLLYSKYHPVQSVQNQTVHFKKDSAVILFGFGLGYEIKAILEKNKYQPIIIFVLAPDLFLQSLSLIDYTDIFSQPSVHFILEPDPKSAKKALMPFFSLILKGFDFVSNPILASSFDLFIKTLREHIFYLFNAHNASVVSNLTNQRRYMINMMLNMMRWNPEQFVQLKNHFSSVPAVCVAAGPSLNKNIAWLSEPVHRAKVIVLACDTAFPALMSHQIIPDLIISADAGLGNMRHFEAYWEHCKTIPMIVDPMICPYIPKNYPGPLIFYPIRNPLFQWVTENQFSDPLYRGVTVSTICTSTAHFLGCSPIILIGCDFSVSDHASYAKGTAKKASKFQIDKTGRKYKEDTSVSGEKVKSYLKTLPGYDGQPVYADEVLFGFLQDMEAFIETHAPIHIIDATEGGSAIKGAQQQPLLSALQALQHNIPAHIITSLAAFPSTLPIKSKLKTLSTKLKKIAKIAQKALQLSQLIQATDIESQQKLNQLIDDIYQDEDILAMVQLLMSAEMHFVMTKDAIAEKHKLFFEGIGQSVAFIQMMIKITLNLDPSTAQISPCPNCAQETLPIDQFRENSINPEKTNHSVIFNETLLLCKSCSIIFRRNPQCQTPQPDHALDSAWKKFEAHICNQTQWISFSDMWMHDFIQCKTRLLKLPQDAIIGFYIRDIFLDFDPVFSETFPVSDHFYFTKSTAVTLLNTIGFEVSKIQTHGSYQFIAAKKTNPPPIPFQALELTHQLRQKNHYDKLFYQAYLFFSQNQIETALRFLERCDEIIPHYPATDLFRLKCLNNQKK